MAKKCKIKLKLTEEEVRLLKRAVQAYRDDISYIGQECTQECYEMKDKVLSVLDRHLEE